MRCTRKTVFKATPIILLLSLASSASTDYFVDVMDETKVLLKSVGAGMALVLIGYYAIKWIMADNPEARMEVKNSLKWVIIGLIVIAMAYGLACGILGYSASSYYGVDISAVC